MATNEEIQEALNELAEVFKHIDAFREKYGYLLEERSLPQTDKERNDAARKILNKYSNL